MNNPKAMMVLGRLYEEGLGTKRDLAKALAYYEFASQHSEPYGLYKIGTFLEQGIHHQCIEGQPMREQALQYFREAQNQGILEQESLKEASFKVAQYFQYGYGVEKKNLTAAKVHYESAAADGHIESMNALGSLFFNDMKDYDQAAAWFRKATERGHTRAICNLGICYELGLGVEKDWN